LKLQNIKDSYIIIKEEFSMINIIKSLLTIVIIMLSLSTCSTPSTHSGSSADKGKPDPTKWTVASTGTIFGTSTATPSTHTPNSVHAVAFGGGRFVAVGDRGKMAHSADGITWTAVSNTTFGESHIYSIAYGGGRFVAGGADGKMAHSTNGTTWTSVSDSTFANSSIIEIAYGGGRFVAIGGGRRIAHSANGTTWTASGTDIFAGGYAPLNCITFGNRRFVMGRANTTCAACNPNMGYSTDGGTWTGVINDVFNLRTNGINSIAYGDKKFIAVGGLSGGASPGSGRSLIAQSSNGASWTAVTSRNVFGTEPIYAITYGGSYFVAAGSEGRGYSANGTTWTAINSRVFGENDLVRHITYGNGRFVMVGDSYTRVGNNPMRTWFGKIWYSEGSAE